MTCHLINIANTGLLKSGQYTGIVNTWTESSEVRRCVKRTPVNQPLTCIRYSAVHAIPGLMHLSAGTRDLVVVTKSGYFQPTPTPLPVALMTIWAKARRRWSLAALA